MQRGFAVGCHLELLLETRLQGWCFRAEDAVQGPARLPPPLKLIGRHEDGDSGHVLGLEDTVQVLGHVHIHLDGLGALEALHQDELPGVPVRALHHKVPTVVAARDAEAEAVRARPAGSCRRGHAEQWGGSQQLGWQRKVVEGDGFGGLVA